MGFGAVYPLNRGKVGHDGLLTQAVVRCCRILNIFGVLKIPKLPGSQLGNGFKPSAD